MLTPSGWRSSDPVPVPNIKGSAPKIAATVVMRIGRKRSRQALKIASRGANPSSCCATMAKSIINMAFFLTMPMSRMMPIKAMMVRSSPNSMRASSAPMPADGKVDRIVIGWMKLSYKTPSTMYMTMTAAISNNNSLVKLLRNASAAP